MSALLTHAAFALLLALAMRVPPRLLPFAVGLAIAPDLDHLDHFLGWTFLESRGTFHNAFVLAVIPGLLMLVPLRGRWEPLLPLARAAPVLLAGHVLIDLLPLDPVGWGGWALLLYPFDSRRYTLDYREITPMDPTTFSTVTIALVLAAIACAAAAWVVARERAGGRGAARARTAWAGAWVLAPFLLVALTSLGPEEGRPMAALAVGEAALEDGRLLVAIVHEGGDFVPARDIRLEITRAGEVIYAADNPESFHVGEAWWTRADLDAAPGALVARVVAVEGGHVYAQRALARLP